MPGLAGSRETVLLCSLSKAKCANAGLVLMAMLTLCRYVNTTLYADMLQPQPQLMVLTMHDIHKSGCLRKGLNLHIQICLHTLSNSA